MKRILILVLALFVALPALAETITWGNPTTYSDGSSIPSANRSQLSTEIQYKTGTGSYTTFGIATNGASTLTGAYVTPYGQSSTWRARSISVADNNTVSAWGPEVPFVRGYPAPAAPSGMTVQ